MCERFPSLAMVLIGLVIFTVACNCGDDDDDDSGGGDDATDDDAGDDDGADDDMGDDDTDDDADDDADDDTADDDTTDDDTADDDTADDDTTDDDTTDDDTDVVFDLDFEDYSVGALPSPWVVEVTGLTTIGITTISKDGSGNVISADGSGVSGDSGRAYYPFGTQTGDIEISFDVWREVGAVFKVELWGGTIASTIAQIDNARSEDTYLVAWNGETDSFVECLNPYAHDQWYEVTFVLNQFAWTYSVEIDGSSNNCTDLPMYDIATQDVGYIVFSDWHFADLGGLVQYDNLTGTLIPVAR